MELMLLHNQRNQGCEVYQVLFIIRICVRCLCSKIKVCKPIAAQSASHSNQKLYMIIKTTAEVIHSVHIYIIWTSVFY